MSGRIRTIKPELLDDEVAVALSDAAWRVWVSTWAIADDHGNLRLGSKFIAAKVWHDTTRDADEPLRELIRAGRIVPYSVRGQRYGHVANWVKHQRIDNAGKPRVPPPAENDETWSVSEFLRGSRLDHRPPTTDHDHDHDQDPPLVGSSNPTLALPVSTSNGTQTLASTEPVQATLAIDATPAAPPKSTEATAIREVFDHWVTGWKRVVRGTRTPTLDDKRRGKIRARLREGYTVADLRRAVDGLWESAWHMEKKQWDIELVCRDAAHVDRFIAEAPEQASGTFPVAPPAEPYESIPPPPEALAALEALDLAMTPRLLREANDENRNRPGVERFGGKDAFSEPDAPPIPGIVPDRQSGPAMAIDETDDFDDVEVAS
jgi:hypothetical protein